MVKKLFFIATLLYIGATVSAENYLVKSPDGKIVAELNTNKSLSLQFKYNGSILLQESSIGVTLNDGMDMGKNPKVASHKLSNHKETIHAPFYRQQNFETAYQELNLKLKFHWLKNQLQLELVILLMFVVKSVMVKMTVYSN